MIQRPKHIIKNFKNRINAVGKERRLNMEKIVLENQPNFPKTLNYEDIDLAVYEWLDKEFDLACDGNKLKTYKLFSNQRISEYGQAWQNLDEKGNLDINFKTITRESNPQKGEIQGGNYAIPENIRFTMFRVKGIDENGSECIETYSMKQPVSVNLIYNIGIFTNFYAMLNRMNTMVHQQFRSLEKYIFPNGFAIPMELNSVSDESEYTIDDRKYYSQTFQIKVMAYLITNDDYVVTKCPARAVVPFMSGRNAMLRRKKRKFNIDSPDIDPDNITVIDECTGEVELSTNIKQENTQEIMEKPTNDVILEIEELEGQQVCWQDTEDELYVNRKVVFTSTFDCRTNHCNNVCEFVSEYNLMFEKLELKNIKNYKFYVNGVLINLEDSDAKFLKGDHVKIIVYIKNEREVASLELTTYDVDSMVKNDINQQTEEIKI